MYLKNQEQEERKLSFSTNKVSKILGFDVSISEIKEILQRYNYRYTENEGNFEIVVPTMRLDLVIEEDMAEEIGRIYGYGRVIPKIPKINFKPKTNETFAKMFLARKKLLEDGYSEVMTYSFRDKGEVEVLASASDKKFLRNNLADGLKESLKLNQLNMPLLEMQEIKIFEIGTVFFKDREEMHVAYNEKNNIKEVTLGEFCKDMETSLDTFAQVLGSPRDYAWPDHSQKHTSEVSIDTDSNSHPQIFKPWSIYPFISRDVAVWMPEGENPEKLKKILIENGTELLIKEPYLFDSFSKNGRTSYAFRLIFQSYDRTLRDEEVNEIMTKISHKIKENSSWEIR